MVLDLLGRRLADIDVGVTFPVLGVIFSGTRMFIERLLNDVEDAGPNLNPRTRL